MLIELLVRTSTIKYYSHVKQLLVPGNVHRLQAIINT